MSQPFLWSLFTVRLTAVYQTAQRTYIAALKAEIEKSGVAPIAEEEAQGD